MKALFFYLVTLTSSALACSVLPPGYDWSDDDLAKYSTHIGLYELIKAEPYPGSEGVINYTLQLIEPVRGDFNKLNDPKIIVYPSYKHKDGEHFLTDFNGHKNQAFWNNKNGRMPCKDHRCHCHMNHSFRKGETYLLFLAEMQGAKKSAEIIKNKQDKWYQFVKNTKYIALQKNE